MKQQKYFLLSAQEHKDLFNAIYDWRLYEGKKALANSNETVSEIYKQTIIDADTPYQPDLLPKAKQRNLAHVRELDIKSFWVKANANGW